MTTRGRPRKRLNRVAHLARAVRIGVDFDDVLYPYHRFLKERILHRFGIDLRTREIPTFYYETLAEFRDRGISREEVWEEVQATWREVENHSSAPLLDPEAVPVLRDLRQRHEVVLVTARHAESFRLVASFLARHDIQPHKVQMDAHQKAGFDVLVDDFPKHALQNVETGGHSLLYHSPENSTFDHRQHPRIHRVRSWAEVRQEVSAIAKERPGIDGA